LHGIDKNIREKVLLSCLACYS